LNTDTDKVYISRDVIVLEGNHHGDDIQNETSEKDAEVEVNVESELKK